jgi:hypothetical protein
VVPQGENILGSWKIDRTPPKMNITLVFLGFLALFVLSFFYIYLLERSTNVLLLAVPLLLFLPLIPTFREFLAVNQIFKEDLEYFVTETGIYVVYRERNASKYLPWGDIKQYDSVPLPSGGGFFDSIVPKPRRLIVRSEIQENSFVVDVFDDDAAQLIDLFKTNNIPFGFSTQT